MNSTGKQLVSGVFYTAIAKYSAIFVSLAVVGVLARVPTITKADFGIMATATVIIAFFSIFSDLGVGPAVIQNRTLEKRDLSNIFSFTIWMGVILSGLFFISSRWIADFYDHSAVLGDICRVLSVNLFFATVNIVPNALIYKEKRFRFVAVRTLIVQSVCGAAAIAAALNGAGIYSLAVAPVSSSVILFGVNFREYPQRPRLTWGGESIRKIFSFSMYQFFFNVVNYFSRNLDKLLTGKFLGMDLLGYYEKSYRLMMLPLQNITHVVSPVMHPIFADFQNDLRRLSDSYLKVVRFLAFVGFPLSAFLVCSAGEVVRVVFGPGWELSVPPFRILALSVGVQIVLSTSGSIFQAANSTRMLFVSGLLSAVFNVAAICLGIFVFGTLEALAWCICVSFTLNFVQSYYLMYYRTFRLSWVPFWKKLVSPLALSVAMGGALYFAGWALDGMSALGALLVKGFLALTIWLGYIQLAGEYDIKGAVREKLKRKGGNHA